MSKPILIAVFTTALALCATSSAEAKCGKGVTIRNDNGATVTITQISYRVTGTPNFTVWPNAAGVPHDLAAADSWIPVPGQIGPNCNQPIEVKVDYTLNGVATYEVDEITEIARLVTLQTGP